MINAGSPLLSQPTRYRYRRIGSVPSLFGTHSFQYTPRIHSHPDKQSFPSVYKKGRPVLGTRPALLQCVFRFSAEADLLRARLSPLPRSLRHQSRFCPRIRCRSRSWPCSCSPRCGRCSRRSWPSGGSDGQGLVSLNRLILYVCVRVLLHRGAAVLGSCQCAVGLGGGDVIACSS